MVAELLYSSGCKLGESPLWDAKRMSCFWVDIEGKEIYEYKWDTSCVTRYQLEHRVSLIVPGKNDDFVVAMQGGIARLNIATRKIQHLTDFGLNWNHLRCNDGICDSSGRLWVGTTDLLHQPRAGAVYCIDHTKRINEKIPEVTISNGMAWSKDNLRLYFTDSITRQVCSFHFDEASGDISFEKVVLRIPENAGLPDGMAMDEEGKLWIALWDGFGVGRFDLHSGNMIDFVNVPVPHVTSCCFAGADLNELVITTAKEGLTKKEISDYPLSGDVFIVNTGVKGMSAFKCGL